MFRSLPPLAILLGVAGLIPFFILGLGAVGTDPLKSMAAAEALVGYGAVILAFIGGVHWGFTLGEHDTLATGGPPARFTKARLTLGILPSLIGWAAILLAILLHPVVSLLILAGGYIATLIMEFRAEKRDLLPGDYLALRTVLSGIALCVLIAVMVVRSIGGHVLL
jgi:hypothetical protein